MTPPLRVNLVGAGESRATFAARLEADGLVVEAPGDVTVVLALDDEEAGLAAVRAHASEGGHVVAVAPPQVIAPRRALDAGASGVVSPEQAADALEPTIRAVLAGQVAVPHESRSQLERPMLTIREKQTLAMVVLGLSNGEIARKLFVTESTVKSHLGSSFKKLGVASRKQAVARILDPDGGLGTGILSITGGELIGPDTPFDR